MTSNNTWMMKELIAKISGILFLTAVISADKLPSFDLDLQKVKKDDLSLFAAKPSSEDLEIPSYFSIDDLKALEDIFGDYSDLALQTYLPPSSVLSEIAPPSPQSGYSAPSAHATISSQSGFSAPLIQSGYSTPSIQSGYSAPSVQSGHAAPAARSSFTAVPAVQLDKSLELFGLPKNEKQLGSFFGSSSDSYSSHEVSKSSHSSNSLLTNQGRSGGGGGDYAQGSNKGMPYAFDYAVKDDYHKNDYGHKESSDGDVVTGEYRVLLPDGRTQIVSYTADYVKGYQANVRYEGEAKFPEPSPKENYGSQQGSFGNSKQLHQSYNSLSQEAKEPPFKQFQLSNPLPLESHSRDIPEQSHSISGSQQSYSPPEQSFPTPQDSYSSPEQSFPTPQESYSPPQQSFSPPQQSYSAPQQSFSPPQQSYSPPQQNFYPPQPSYSAPKQPLQIHSPTKQQQQKFAPPIQQQSYSPPQAKPIIAAANPQKNNNQPKPQLTFGSSKPQEKYTQPVLQQSYSLPEPRQSNAAPLRQQSFLIPHPNKQSFSQSVNQESYASPPEPEFGFVLPQPKQSFSLSELQQSITASEPQQQGFIIPQPTQSFSVSEPQQSYTASEPQQQGFVIPQPKHSFTATEPQDSYTAPEPNKNLFVVTETQQSYNSLESREPSHDSSKLNDIDLGAATINLYLPPAQSKAPESAPEIDGSYLPPLSTSNSRYRKRSAASALYRKKPKTVVFKPSQKIPLKFEPLKNRISKKEKESLLR